MNLCDFTAIIVRHLNAKSRNCRGRLFGTITVKVFIEETASSYVGGGVSEAEMPGQDRYYYRLFFEFSKKNKKKHPKKNTYSYKTEPPFQM